MIKFKEDGKNFSYRFCEMVTCYREISEDEYTRLSALSPSEIRAEIEDSLPIEILAGYGFYGGGITERDDRKYVCYKRGSSCD